MLRLARVSVRSLSHTRILASGPAPFNNLPGSFLNGEDGRTMEKVADIGPPAAEEVLLSDSPDFCISIFQAYKSHEYYNHDKVSFYDALADCNHMRVEPPDAGFIDIKHRK